MGMIRANNIITISRRFPLYLKILLMGNLKTLLFAKIEAVPAGRHLIDDVFYISSMIIFLYSDKQPAASLLLDVISLQHCLNPNTTGYQPDYHADQSTADNKGLK